MKFCNKCGSKLVNGLCPNCSQVKKKKNKFKILTIGLAFIILVFAYLFIYLKSTVKSEREIAQDFSNSINSSNAEELTKILYCNDSSLPINKSNSNILIDYFSKNPSKFSSINDDFKKGIYKDTNSPLSIEEVRKDFLVIPVYKVVIKPSFIKVNTEVKDAKLKIGDETFSDLTEKEEVGPLMPGDYVIKAEISNSYLNKSEDIEVNTFKLPKQDIYIFEDFVKINITSDRPDAELYINNKDTGLKIKDSKKLGPIEPNSIIYGVAKNGDKQIISNKYDTSYLESVNINFAEVKAQEANFKKDLYVLLRNYSNDFAYAVNTNTFSYVENYLEFDSPIYKKQKRVIPDIYYKDIRENFESTEILNYTFNKDSNLGEVTCNEIYSIAKGYNVPKRQVFKNTYTFKRLDNGTLVITDIKD